MKLVKVFAPWPDMWIPSKIDMLAVVHRLSCCFHRIPSVFQTENDYGWFYAIEGGWVVCVPQAALRNHKSKLASLDGYSYLDSLWLEAIMGEEGLKSLRDQFVVKCLPTETTSVTIADAVKEAKKLKECDLFKVLEQEFQNRLTTCAEWLDCLQTKTPPSSFRHSNAFLTEVWARLPLFFEAVVKKPDGASGPSAVPLKGIVAITQAWEKMKDKPNDQVQVSDLDAVYVFKPWMPAETQKAITKKRQAVVSTALKSKPARKPEVEKVSKCKLSADDKALLAARKVLAKKK
eukprot:6491674-Amphidinium_carterae.1